MAKETREYSTERSQAALAALDGRNGVWSIDAWCFQAGMSHVKFGKLKPQPRMAKSGRLVRILESPADYFASIAVVQPTAQRDDSREPVRAA